MVDRLIVPGGNFSTIGNYRTSERRNRGGLVSIGKYKIVHCLWIDILQLILNSHAISISEAPNLTAMFYAQLCGRSFFIANNRINFQYFKEKLKIIQDHELKSLGILLF